MKGSGCYKEDCEHFDPDHGFCKSTDDMMDSSNLIFPVPICKLNPKAVDNKEWERLAAEAKKPPAPPAPESRPSTYDWIKGLRETFESNMYVQMTVRGEPLNARASDKISWWDHQEGTRAAVKPPVLVGRTSAYDGEKSPWSETFESNLHAYGHAVGAKAADKSCPGLPIPRLCSTCRNSLSVSKAPPCDTCARVENLPNWRPSMYYKKGERIEKRTEN